MSGGQEKIGWKGSQDSAKRRRSVPGYLDTCCRKTNTERWHIPLQLGIALASQCLLSYTKGRGRFVRCSSQSIAEGRTLTHKGGQDESPTARSFHCGSPIDAGNGLYLCPQRGRSESCAP